MRQHDSDDRHSNHSVAIRWSTRGLDKALLSCSCTHGLAATCCGVLHNSREGVEAGVEMAKKYKVELDVVCNRTVRKGSGATNVHVVSCPLIQSESTDIRPAAATRISYQRFN